MVEIRAFWGFVLFWVMVLPMSLILLGLIRRKDFHPIMRSGIVLSPALLWNLPSASEAVFSPERASGDFARRMNHPLPPTARELRAWCFRLRESSYMFSFSTTREETDALLTSGQFRRLESRGLDGSGPGMEFRLPVGGQQLPQDWPNPGSWEEVEIHESATIADYAYILTDKWHTNVLVLVGDT